LGIIDFGIQLFEFLHAWEGKTKCRLGPIGPHQSLPPHDHRGYSPILPALSILIVLGSIMHPHHLCPDRTSLSRKVVLAYFLLAESPRMVV